MRFLELVQIQFTIYHVGKASPILVVLVAASTAGTTAAGVGRLGVGAQRQVGHLQSTPVALPETASSLSLLFIPPRGNAARGRLKPELPP